ncbi:hypothetical protein HK097_001626 [Rhizophlyctis rosea]|uniref:Uncharacterized protein n=1 Tax=Rhizophlyctis rosea TaxID=64517 RepID=A0AAD5S4B5_9FUNG|nr:hypothetical protein HK097_001626 [Rhizophlyctis rosea]
MQTTSLPSLSIPRAAEPPASRHTSIITPPWKGGMGAPGSGSMAGTGKKESELSGSTRLLLKSMMHQSKLSLSQQRFLDTLIQDGAALPQNPSPHINLLRDPTTSSPQILNSRPPRPRPITYYRRPAVRTLDKIIDSGAFEPEVFRGGAKKNSTHEKEKLQNYMASNGATTSDPALLHSDTTSEPPDHSDPVELDEFNMVMQEIQERRQWLDDMIKLGRGDKYKGQIRNEIAVRISRLEQLDRERTRNGT